MSWPFGPSYPDNTPSRHGVRVRLVDAYNVCATCGGRDGKHSINCLWHNPDAEFNRRLPLYPPLPAHRRSLPAGVGLTLVAAFLLGIGLVWLWGRVVVSCQ